MSEMEFKTTIVALAAVGVTLLIVWGYTLSVIVAMIAELQ